MAYEPTLTSPTNGATGVSTSPTLEWEPVSGASKYQVQVATSEALLTSTPDILNEEVTSGSGLLILDSRSAIAKAKVKPKQYDLKTAQYSIKRNCEDWLGVDKQLLVSACQMWDKAGNVTDLVSGRCQTTGATWFNNGINHNGTGLTTVPQNSSQNNLPGITSIIKCETPAYNSTQEYLIEKSNNAVSGWRIRFLQGRVDFRVDFSTTDLQKYANAAALPSAGGVDTYTWRWGGSSDHESVGLRINNEEITSWATTISGVGARASDSGNNICIANEPGLAYGYEGLIDYVYLFSGALSDDNVDKLYSAPYALLTKRTPRVYSIGSSTPATSKTLSSLTAGQQHFWRVRADV